MANRLGMANDVAGSVRIHRLLARTAAARIRR
jgi:hypothetical protein